MEKQDEKWIAALKIGDKTAYEKIFKAYYSYVYSVAYRLTRDANIAKDACQEVFLELWKNRNKLTIKRSLKSYLHRGVINRSLNIIKSRKHHSGQELTVITEKTTNTTPQQILEHNELAQQLQKGIDSLPKRCRAVFVLSRHEGKSYKEIAGLLDISVKTVENQMIKALKALRSVVRVYRRR